MIRTICIVMVIAICFPVNAAVTPPATAQKVKPREIRQKQEQPERITILSIIPAQGEPGMTVTLSGSGFSEKAAAFIGSSELPAKLLGPKQLSFEIPRLASGLYALFVKNDDGSTSKTYSFSVQPIKPVVQSLSPDTVPACTSAGSREVAVTGKNFMEGSMVLFDGGGIRSRFLSSESMSFSVPAVRGGIHQIQVKNPEETLSTPLSLLIDSRPEITGITPGADYVNYYELSIDGRNFLQGSTLVVDGERITVGTPAPGNRDRLIYMNCTQLIYQRHPADPAPKTLRLQVVNPGNEESPVVTVSTP
jgi:hypothetical protein